MIPSLLNLWQMYHPRRRVGKQYYNVTQHINASLLTLAVDHFWDISDSEMKVLFTHLNLWMNKQVEGDRLKCAVTAMGNFKTLIHLTEVSFDCGKKMWDLLGSHTDASPRKRTVYFY